MDWSAIIGIPSAAGVVIGFCLYFVGVIRPMAIIKPRYWHVEETTQLSCTIKNRKWRQDRTFTRITLVSLPSRFDRKLGGWRRKPQPAAVVPWGSLLDELKSGGITIAKRDERAFELEIRLPNGVAEALTPKPNVRIEAWAGSKHSRSKKLKPLPGARPQTRPASAAPSTREGAAQ